MAEAAGLQRRSPRMLVIVHHEDAALPIDAAIGAVDQIVRRRDACRTNRALAA